MKMLFIIFCFCFVVIRPLSFGLTSEQKQSCEICKYKNFGIIISGPSGVGKTTIINKLKEKYQDLSVSISATTRQPRIGEISGKDYYFLDRDKFEELVKKDEFIEYAENYGKYYGSPRRNYIEAVENGKNVIFALSVDGMQNAKKNNKLDLVTIFISPITEEQLYKRLVNRGTETEKQIKKRFENAKYEMSFADKYDYVVYNNKLEQTIKQVEAIYLAEQRKREFCRKSS